MKCLLSLCISSVIIPTASIVLFVPTGSSAQFVSNNVCSHSKTWRSGIDDETQNYYTDTLIDVTYYGLDLQVFTDPNIIRGSVVITARSLSPELNNFYYNFSSNMTVDSVTDANIQLSYIHSNDRISFTTAVPPGINQPITLKIHYHGTPVATGFGSFVFDKINGRPSIWTLSEPYGAMDWFPCKNTPADKADSSDVKIRCSESMTAVSNGVLLSALNNGDGTITYHWKNSYPIAQYLISLAISDYVQFFFNYNYGASKTLPIENYIYPETFPGLEPLLLKTNNMLDIFRNIFGEYPFITEKYGHAEFGRLGAIENQTISSMGIFDESIMAHELAHQWFGDKITCRDWENIWLNEGFATYSEALYAEFEYGKDAYNQFIRSRMSNALQAQGSVFVQDIKSVSQIFDGNRSYAKGAVILHMLRGITGDTAFFRIIKKYAGDTALAYKTAVTSEFQAVAESVTLTDLDYFFNEWIYGEGYPKYDVSWTTSENSTGYMANINIEQRPGTTPQFFTMPLDIRVNTLSGDTVFRVFNNSRFASYNVRVTSKPLSFEIDPYDLILKEVRGEGIIPVNFQLQQNFPNPFNPSTTIVYELARPSDVVLEIYDVLGRQVCRSQQNGIRDGTYSVVFDAVNLSSGAYFYTLTAYAPGESDVLFSETRRMIYIR